ncbi:hypothetical protein TNCT_292861 [Trichonephila clavata]|uniref:Uncharacterized protein n=1 Tax=Trichonephila clavata TaxID=2740835 RepID=A0A8X6JPN1_TRICU|nr:hypothetical protein TNCT_292861 [Trichonephila clavata]
MVTNQAPFHHLQKTWERRFTGPLGDSLIVTSIVSGHFTDTKEIQIAVTVQDGLNATLLIIQDNIKILDRKRLLNSKLSISMVASRLFFMGQ